MRTPSVKKLMDTCKLKVVELKFVRRREKKGFATTRRMFCTLHSGLLNSPFGREVMNFRAAMNPPPFNAAKYGLVTVWDILAQNYRNVPVESCEVIQAIDPDTKNDFKGFISYFDKHIKKMTDKQKKNFMNV